MAKKEVVSAVTFKMAERNLKYLGRNLTKGAEELYDENYKTYF